MLFKCRLNMKKSHFIEWLFLFFVAFRFCTQKSHFVFPKLRFWFCRDYTPAGAGPWHFFVVKTLTSVYHVGQATAKSFAFVSHGLKTCLVLILGILGYAGYYRSLFLWWRRKH